jgi:hypothetical protein
MDVLERFLIVEVNLYDPTVETFVSSGLCRQCPDGAMDVHAMERFTIPFPEHALNRQLPLAYDLSTPLLYFFYRIQTHHAWKPLTESPLKAYFEGLPRQPSIPYVSGFFHFDTYRAYQGLYLISPFNPSKIPLILIHGFLSNVRNYFIFYFIDCKNGILR